MFDTLTQFFLNLLLSINDFVGNLGLSIIFLTILVRTVLTPLTLPSLKARKKIKELQPELKKLKKKFKGKALEMQQAQAELYKKYNVNPLAGCIPQLVQIVFLVILYRALTGFLTEQVTNNINTNFLWLNVTEPDSKYILPILAGLAQLALSIMIAPGAEVEDKVPNKSKSKKVQKKNEQEEDVAEMAASMQQQMIYILPFFTMIIALQFPAGLALYYVTTTLFSIVQQYFVSGWGGLKTYYLRLKLKFRK